MSALKNDLIGTEFENHALKTKLANYEARKQEIVKEAPVDIIIELQELLKEIRNAEIKLAEMQQRYIQFITEKVMQYENS